MRIAFRTDASIQIGTGHVMRCLTLADALAIQGADCQFICRAHEGNLIEMIRSKGYITYALPVGTDDIGSGIASIHPAAPELLHSHWLGATQAQDAEACAPILAGMCPDWLIVDHYALDVRWESFLAPYFGKLMVIDDLADRPHECALLLDQTFGRIDEDYLPLLPASCRLLCGSQYALLRPEFAALRSYSLRRRAKPHLRQLLITMGGVDKDNATAQVLQALRKCLIPADCQITVVMGATAPWLEEVQNQAQYMPWPTRVLVGVSNMAQIIADSDLAIGAAGSTSWERCCLGLPTIMLVLAENQRAIAQALFDTGAAHLVDIARLKNQPIIPHKLIDPRTICSMIAAAAAVTDGSGASKVIYNLTQ